MVVRSGERLLLADHGVVKGIEELVHCQKQIHFSEDGAYLRTGGLRLKHDRGVSELLDETVPTLDSWEAC